MSNPVLKNPWVRAIAVLLFFVGTLMLMYFLRSVLVPLAVAFLVAYIFNPLINAIESRKVPRMAAILGLLVGMALLAVSFPLIVLPNMVEEAREFAQGGEAEIAPSPEAGEMEDSKAALERKWLRGLVNFLGWVPVEYVDTASDNAVVDEIPADAEPGRYLKRPITDFDPREVLRVRIGELIAEPSEDAVNLLRSSASTVIGISQKSLASIASLFSSLGSELIDFAKLVGNIVLFTFVTVYLLKDYKSVIDSARALVPGRMQGDLGRIMGRIDTQLRAFFRGQLMVCACLGILYAIGLKLSGVPFAIPLAIFGGLSSFVPFLGLALTIGPAVLLTLLYHGLDLHVLFVILTFVVAQALEGNYLTPKIVGSQVGLSPVWVILAVMTFGGTFGFLGLLVAVPLAAVLKVLVLEAVARYKDSAFFVEADADED